MYFSRRKFLATTSAWAASSSLGFTKSTDHKTVSILHTTDLHGHILPTTSYTGATDVGGFARCATQIRAWRKENPDSLLVDVGDLYQGTAESFNNQGRLFVDLLGNFEYDAWTLGNHDFDWGPEVLEKNLQASKTDILTANLTGVPENVIPWKMCQVGGFKIALIGLITPGLPYWLMPETLGGISPIDPAISLKKSIAQAKSAKADAIIVLGHFGHRKEDDFANPIRHTLATAPGADIFIAGHTHQHVPSLELGETLFTQANYFGINCGKIDLTFDTNSRKLIAKTATTSYMDKKFGLDPGVINLSQPDLKKSKEQLARKLTTLTEPIIDDGRYSPLPKFICKSISDTLAKNKTPVDAVFHGTFGTKTIPAGPVTVADAWKILPYENTLVTVTLTPAQLLEIIAEDRKTYSDRTLYPYEVIFEERVPTRILKDGSDLPPEKPITVAFNSYDSQSGGHRLLRLRELVHLPTSNRTPINLSTRDGLIESFLNL
ncbi:MAG: bifunctional metallophosphatase/5'-nucleotidase [Luteolibacter sp.]